MYIKSLHIENMRALDALDIDFTPRAGWHVLLGDNGSGKSTVVKAISAALIGPTEILRLDPNFSTWVKNGKKAAIIDLTLERDLKIDKRSKQGGAKGGVKDIDTILCKTIIKQHEGNGQRWFFEDNSPLKKDGAHPSYYNWGTGAGWFSAAFGPYRRITGGDLTLEKFYFRNPKIGAHLTAFREEAALTESVVWLKDKLLRSLSSPKTDNLKTNNSKTDDSETDDPTLTALIDFINHDGLLPEGFKLEKLTPDGLFFKVPKSNGLVHLYELSEGIKSVMSLTLELLRLLLDVYTPAVVFGNFLDKNQVEKSTQVNGVVLIDEIDVHLHPTWQTRIGQWFTSCFPNIQFIVTTHSPLICRAAVKGSVWQLPPPKSNQKTRRIEGAELHQLLYGDVLDAFSTGVFGESVTRSAAGHAKLERLAELNIRYYRQEASASELAERQILLDLFPANDSLFAQ